MHSLIGSTSYSGDSSGQIHCPPLLSGKSIVMALAPGPSTGGFHGSWDTRPFKRLKRGTGEQEMEGEVGAAERHLRMEGAAESCMRMEGAVRMVSQTALAGGGERNHPTVLTMGRSVASAFGDGLPGRRSRGSLLEVLGAGRGVQPEAGRGVAGAEAGEGSLAVCCPHLRMGEEPPTWEMGPRRGRRSCQHGRWGPRRERRCRPSGGRLSTPW